MFFAMRKSNLSVPEERLGSPLETADKKRCWQTMEFREAVHRRPVFFPQGTHKKSPKTP
jgi:hypothetical protein